MDDDDSLVIELSSDDEDIKHIFETKRTTNKPVNIRALQDYRELHEQRHGTSPLKNSFCLPQRHNNSFNGVANKVHLQPNDQLTWREALNRRAAASKKAATRNGNSDRVNYSNCGIHSDDTLNVPDEQGRVLVNVDHPQDDPDIFFAPQLAHALKPHQIGGVRFLYDNVVVDLKSFNTNPGQGCILAHSMGLGKTIQLCSFIDVFITDVRARHVLCIVPVNTLQNWLSEFDMWIPVKKNSRRFGEKGEETRYRKFDIYQMTDARTFEARVNVVRKWRQNGGVLLMGYEIFRILTLPRKKGSKHFDTNIIYSDFIDFNGDSEGSDSDLDKSSTFGDIRSYLTIPANGSKRYNDQTNSNGFQEKRKEKKGKSAWDIIKEALLDPGPDLVVCDEGHRIKNGKAATSIALKQIATKRRIVLTGYPLQNNLIEYWCMVDFVKPGYLGTQRDFTVLFERPITAGQCLDSTPLDKRVMRYRAHVLHRILEQFVQRRSHSLLRNHLPRKHEHVILIRMTKIQRELISGFVEQIKLADMRTQDNRLRVNALLLFAVCCKIWNHPDIFYAVVKEKCSDVDLAEMQELISSDVNCDSNSTGAGTTNSRCNSNPISHMPSTSSSSNGEKITGIVFDTQKCSKSVDYSWAESYLDDYVTGLVENSYKMVLFMFILRKTVEVGDRILLFSQSLLTLDLIEEYLSRQYIHNQSDQKWRRDVNYYRIDGMSTPFERERYIDSFNKDEQYKLFLISTRAGSLGINLTGANRIVIFDSSWNPCHDAQAACRVYRYGQKKECFIYRFVCDNTLEKRIYDRQINKQGMANRVVDQLNHESRLTWQEITQLVLDFDGQSDPPPVEMTNEELNEFSDPLVRAICTEFKNAISARPFEHESLLLDHEETKLTEKEKIDAEATFKKAPNPAEMAAATLPGVMPGILNQTQQHIAPTFGADRNSFVQVKPKGRPASKKSKLSQTQRSQTMTSQPLSSQPLSSQPLSTISSQPPPTMSHLPMFSKQHNSQNPIIIHVEEPEIIDISD